MSESTRFKSSEASHVGHDHMAKKPDLADKTCFKRAFSIAMCHLHRQLAVLYSRMSSQ